jgi:soluble lytic murein transglycosylase
MRQRLGWRGLGGALVAVCLLGAGAVPQPAEPETDLLTRTLLELRRQLDFHNAEAALEQLAILERSGALADHAALLRARLLRSEARPEEALGAARAGLAANPPSELRSELHRELARSHIDRGQLLEAYEQQRSAWEATARGERAAALVWELAQAFDAAGLAGEALSLYRRVWSDWPVSGPADAAFQRGEALAQQIGAEPPPAYAVLERAHRLRGRFRCEPALALYERALQRAGELDARAQRGAQEGRADCLFGTRRYAEAVEAYRELDRSRLDPADVEAALGVARSYARQGLDAEALEELARARKRAGAEGRAKCDHYAAIVVRTKQPARYLQLLQRVEKQGASPSLAQGARWSLAWAEVEAGRLSRALPRLVQLSRGPLDDIEVQRARYWRAVAQPKPRARTAQLEELARGVPLSYYGILAANRLDSAPEPMRTLLGERSAGPVETPALRTRWLLDGGFAELALLELDSWMAAGGLTREQRLRASELLHALGQHQLAVQIVSDGFGATLERGVDPRWRDAWELAWPRPFEAPVRAAVQEFGFDPSLVYAVMREESTYRPEVESPAGAIGLMQIIPPTGSLIAQQLSLGSFEDEWLRRPEVNIRFGTYYLKSLVGRFQGSQPLAIAAYNAGPEAVNRWLEERLSPATDVFVEGVPYGETRRYLRRVLRSQRVYRLLYGDEALGRAAGDPVPSAALAGSTAAESTPAASPPAAPAP